MTIVCNVSRFTSCVSLPVREYRAGISTEVGVGCDVGEAALSIEESGDGTGLVVADF